ncbi:MAG TPA: hypothetical protein VM867_07885 [Xanthobacteraceae bacterium]|jgi:hypothetical protein|nr:hypothetical protein [Xanthobacteraceae bacterium]
MAICNITVENDHDFYRLFKYQTAAGVGIDISGTAMWMMLRRRAEDQVALMRLGTDTGEIVLTTPLVGEFSVRIAQIELERLGLGEFDHSLIMEKAGFKRSIWTGKFVNKAGPSR